MSTTFKIFQEECIACEQCVSVSQERIKINDEQKAFFVSTGEDTANFGSEDSQYIFSAIDTCPNDCIKEIG